MLKKMEKKNTANSKEANESEHELEVVSLSQSELDDIEDLQHLYGLKIHELKSKIFKNSVLPKIKKQHKVNKSQ